MDTEAMIRDFASRGFSKRETARTLELSDYMMDKFLSVMGPVKWPTRGNSNNHHRANKEKRGKPNQAIWRALEARRNHALHTVDGITGTIDELASKFGGVTGGRVRARMKEGMTLDEALKTPRQHGNRFRRVFGKEKQPCTAN